MKTLFNLFIITFVASFLIACSSETSSPEAVAESFIKYSTKGDVDNLIKIMDLGDDRELSPEEEKKELRELSSYLTSGMKEERQSFESFKAIGVRLIENGKMADVTIQFKYSDGGERNKVLTLIKRNGQWKVLLG